MGNYINVYIGGNVTGYPGSHVYVEVGESARLILNNIKQVQGKFRGYIKEHQGQEVLIIGYGDGSMCLSPINGESLILTGLYHNLIMVPIDSDFTYKEKSDIPLIDYSVDELQAAIDICCKSLSLWRKKADKESAMIHELSKSLKESEKRYTELNQSIKILSELRDEQS